MTARLAMIFWMGCALALVGAQSANADCVRKHAQATSTSESSAKWFALETMVQSVSWGLWPTFVLSGNVPGYTIKKERYKCKPGDLGITCQGSATFCKTG